MQTTRVTEKKTGGETFSLSSAYIPLFWATLCAHSSQQRRAEPPSASHLPWLCCCGRTFTIVPVAGRQRRRQVQQQQQQRQRRQQQQITIKAATTATAATHTQRTTRQQASLRRKGHRVHWRLPGYISQSVAASLPSKLFRKRTSESRQAFYSHKHTPPKNPPSCPRTTSSAAGTATSRGRTLWSSRPKSVSPKDY